jgi:PAS domain S-box-containing protein
MTAIALSILVIAYGFVPQPFFWTMPGLSNTSWMGLFVVVSLIICSLVAGRRSLLTELRQERDLISAVVNTAGSLIVVLDPQGKIIQFNRTCERITGYSFAEVEGRHIWDLLIPAEEIDLVISTIQQLRAGMVPQEVERTWMTKTGDRRYIAWTTTALFDDWGTMRHIVGTGIDITARKQAETSLQESNQALHALIQASPLAITVMNRQGKVKLWNPAAERIFGWTSTEAIGQLIPTIAQEQRPEFLNTMDRVLRGAVLEGIETRCQQKNGSLMDIGVWTAILRSQMAEADSIISMVADISDRKRLEQQLHRQANELMQANRMKDEFLAVLSHELRTPLNAILGWARLLRIRQFDTTVTSRALETIERNAHLQNQLVSDLLDVSTLIQGKLRLHPRLIHLADVIQPAIDAMRPAAAAKRIHLNVRLAAAVDQISGDPDRLHQIIWNLLSNAVKFTPAGGQVSVYLDCVERTIRTAETSERHHSTSLPHPCCFAQIQVSDTGIGFDPEFAPYLFDRFRQADSTSTRAVGGLGLGLAIVRQLVELHGGSVEAESRGIGQGATFTIRFPILPTSQLLPEATHYLAGDREKNDACSDNVFLPRSDRAGTSQFPRATINQDAPGLTGLPVQLCHRIF